MAGIQFNAINDEPRITSLKGVPPQRFRQELEARRLYYLGLIEFCVKNQDREGAEEMVKDFALELADCFKYIMEDKQQSAAARKEKIKVLVEIARRGFGEYFGAGLVHYNQGSGEFAAYYQWIVDAKAEEEKKIDVLVKYMTKNPDVLKCIVKQAMEIDLDTIIGEGMLEETTDPRMQLLLRSNLEDEAPHQDP